MLNDDEGHAAGRRNMAEELFQCLKAAGRGTDGDNRKGA